MVRVNLNIQKAGWYCIGCMNANTLLFNLFLYVMSPKIIMKMTFNLCGEPSYFNGK